MVDTLANINFVIKYKKILRKVLFLLFVKNHKYMAVMFTLNLEIRLGFLLGFNQISYFKFHISNFITEFQMHISGGIDEISFVTDPSFLW